MNHRGRAHVYHKRHNPSGCDKFYCLRKYRPVYYWLRWRPHGGWRVDSTCVDCGRPIDDDRGGSIAIRCGACEELDSD